MKKVKRQTHHVWMNTGLPSLILAYFFPVYFRNGEAEINTDMVSMYASTYMKRNSVAALTLFAVGEVLNAADCTILCGSVTCLFVVFAGFCGIFLAALFDANRNSN